MKLGTNKSGGSMELEASSAPRNTRSSAKQAAVGRNNAATKEATQQYFAVVEEARDARGAAVLD